MPSEARRKNEDCFQPSSKLLSILQQLLEFKANKRDAINKMFAVEEKKLGKGKELSEEQKEQLKEDFKFEMNNTLRSEKSRVMNDIIFPSMANLIVFFGYAVVIENIENELGEKHMFNHYLQELLFGYNPEYDTTPYQKRSRGNTLYRLTNAMLSLNDLRYIIFQILQEEIYEMLKIAKQSYSKSEALEYVILPDMLRAIVHARSLSNEAQAKGVVNFDRDDRPVRF
jgi:hypothetical protein